MKWLEKNINEAEFNWISRGQRRFSPWKKLQMFKGEERGEIY